VLPFGKTLQIIAQAAPAPKNWDKDLGAMASSSAKSLPSSNDDSKHHPLPSVKEGCVVEDAEIGADVRSAQGFAEHHRAAGRCRRPISSLPAAVQAIVTARR
jgi:hypothetical protein